MVMHLYDGDSWSVYPDLEAAKAAAAVSIDAARDAAKFDREWPDWVGDIRVHEGPADVEDPSELPCVLKAVEINIQRPSSKLDEYGEDDEGNWWDGDDAYTCDFDLAEPVHS